MIDRAKTHVYWPAIANSRTHCRRSIVPCLCLGLWKRSRGLVDWVDGRFFDVWFRRASALARSGLLGLDALLAGNDDEVDIQEPGARDRREDDAGSPIVEAAIREEDANADGQKDDSRDRRKPEAAPYPV